VIGDYQIISPTSGGGIPPVIDGDFDPEVLYEKLRVERREPGRPYELPSFVGYYRSKG
jgi:hypothetical protein